jgi:glycine/D-amino acid oxidase-like deaminating enzyme
MGMRRRIKLLPADDATNGWVRILPAREPRPALEGDMRADWVVVGAGLAGLAAARRLAENRPGEQVALIEAERVGDGASGRNSGFAIDLPHNVGGDMADPEAPRRSMRLARGAIEYLESIVTRHAIDCQWSRRGQYMAASSPLGEAALDGFTDELDGLGEAYRRLDGGDLAAETGASHYRAAVHTPGTVLMQPAALVRGLADSLPENVTLYEESPVIEVEDGAEITLKSPRGSLRARRLVLAVNGLAPQFGHYEGRVFVLGLHASLSRPLSDGERQALGGEDDWGVLPAVSFGGPTMRFTRDRRLLMRHGIFHASNPRATAARNLAARRSHESLFRARFPMLPEVTFEHSWTGFVCMSRNFAPGFGHRAENVYSAVCQNGMGLTKGTVTGLLAADLATGRDNPLIADMEALGQPVVLPPRPFLDLGVSLNLMWRRWRGRHER